MPGPVELERLLAALAAARSPIERVKLVASAWRTLRGLSPSARREVAAHMGLDHAERWLERLERSQGKLSPSLLLQALRRARDADAGDVRDLVGRLRDPQERDALLREGLADGERLLLGEQEQGEPQPPQDEAEEPSADAVEPEIVEPPGPAPSPAPAADRAEFLARYAPAPAPPRPTPSAPPDRVTARAPEARPAPAPRVPRPAAPAKAAPTALAERLEAAPRTLDRLRLLHGAVEEARGLDLDALGRLLEAFPESWARRRALCALLRAGIPEEPRTAIALVARLESPVARRWCARVLLHGRELPDALRRDLAAQVGLARTGRAAPEGARHA